MGCSLAGIHVLRWECPGACVLGWKPCPGVCVLGWGQCPRLGPLPFLGARIAVGAVGSTARLSQALLGVPSCRDPSPAASSLLSFPAAHPHPARGWPVSLASPGIASLPLRMPTLYVKGTVGRGAHARNHPPLGACTSVAVGLGLWEASGRGADAGSRPSRAVPGSRAMSSHE